MGFKQFIFKNSSHILTGCSAIGLVATAILTGKASIKANEIIKAKEEKTGEKLIFSEKIKLTWKCFIPSATVGIATIASSVGAHVIDSKRLSDMTNAYILSKEAMSRYREEVANDPAVGEEHEQEIYEASREKRKDEKPFNPKKQLIFYDPITDREFKATPQDIAFAEGQINRMFQNNTCCSYGYFLKLFGLKPTHYVLSNKIGWWLDDSFCYNSSFFGNWISIEYVKCKDDLGREHYEIVFDHPPMEPDEPDEWRDYKNWEH